MSDSETMFGLAALVGRVRRTRLDRASGAELVETIRSARTAIDALEGLEAEALNLFDQAEAYRDEGASSAAAWARRELRLEPKAARARIRAGRTLRQLPDVASASRSGQIRLEHVKQFTAGVTKAGSETMVEAQSYLVPVAKACDPSELLGTINRLIDAVHPERLDQAYADGMDKVDLKIARCGDGFHVTGFLDIATGAAFKTWLDSAAAPRNAEDKRTPSARRIDAVRELVGSILEHGMPCDRGVRPQLHVSVDAQTLAGDPLGEPANLSGFGPIGADLLDYLRCNADVTPFLVNGTTDGPVPQADVLNVGRSWRLATMKQRAAVRLRQGGTCANPGCSNTHLEIHHVQWWDRDHGRTDLDNLVGVCPTCHHLVHTHKLNVQADGQRGFTFSRTFGRRLDDERRKHGERVRRHLRHLRRLGERPPAPREPDQTEARPSAGPTRPPVQERRRRQGCHDQAWPPRSLAELHLAQRVHQRPPRPPPRT